MSTDLNENSKKLRSSRSSQVVDSQIFEGLKKSYENKFHASPSKLIEKLDATFPDDIRKAKDGSGSLLSDKTIRNFFVEDQPPTASLKTLNYLCNVLLGYESYGEAVTKIELSNTSKLEDGEVNQALDNIKVGSEFHSEVGSEESFQNYLQKTEAKLNTMKVLDMKERLVLNDIYADTYFSEESSNSINDRLARISDANNNAKNKRVPAFDKIKKTQYLMIMGGPGAGKTSFLKKAGLRYLDKETSIQDFGKWYIPVYLSFKLVGTKIEVSDLKSVILERLTGFIGHDYAERMLREGRFLILLDALDEYSNLHAMCDKIEEFLDIYGSNRLIVTTRLGIPDCKIERFDEAMIADFDKDQISTFAKKWFHATKKKELENKESEEDSEIEDWQPDEMFEQFFKELSKNKAIAEASINPLILTYICLRFKEEFGLPKNISGLLKDIVNILLKRWDSLRRIKRIPNDADRLSDDRKIELFGKIAYQGFTNDSCRKFLWKEDELKDEIGRFLKNVSTINLSEIKSATELILGVMIRDHGLFIPLGNLHSFPHLTYQEYFVADYIQDNLSNDPNLLCKTLEKYLFDRQWEQVFLMLVEKISNADEFFKHMFWHINMSIKANSELQKMMCWLNKFTTSLQVNSSAWRSFLLATDLETSLYLKRHEVDVNNFYAQELSDQSVVFNRKRNKITPNQPRLIVSLYLVIIYDLVTDLLGDMKGVFDRTRLKGASKFVTDELKIHPETTISKELDLAIAKAQLIDDMPSLMEKLNGLKETMPQSKEHQAWKEWHSKVLSLMLTSFDVGRKVMLSLENQKALDDYTYATNLLMKCILRENVSDPNLREMIFDHMLLPLDLIPDELLPTSHKNNTLTFSEIG